MKALARSIFWWPNLDADIERLSAQCSDCQQLSRSPAPYPLQPWAWPDRPWSRIHADFAGPVDGRMLLVLIDAYSKWMDVYVMNNTTSATTIQKLRQSFATHGLPDVLVTDNGPNLVSAEMQDFLNKNGIQHIRTAPYHPASNGQAERAVQTIKRSLARQQGGTLEERVARFLLAYRTTPHATTGEPPCQLLMGRRLQSLLDRVRPDLPVKVGQRQAQQKQSHDAHARHRPIATGDVVLAKDFSDSGRWKSAVVTDCKEPVDFQCRFENGETAHRHADQVLRPTGAAAPIAGMDAAQHESSAPVPAAAVTNDAPEHPVCPASDVELPRRSTRVRAPPNRLTYN
jgi:hypothetical protein